MKQPALHKAIEEARSAWPDLPLDPDRFADLVQDRQQEPDPTEAAATDADSTQAGAGSEAVGRLQAADLYLAFGCATGVTAALRAFDSRYGAELHQLAARFASRAHSVEDLVQLLRTKLFVHRADRPARIQEYSGRGTLRAWLRVTALRTFLDETKRGRGREVSLTGSQAMGLPGERDPELDFLKTHYRQHFKEAFNRAVQMLSSEERYLLRLRVLAGLSAEQIGAALGVHRATTDRRLARARQALLRHTRRELQSRLSVDGEEIEQIMGLIRSRLDVSLPRLLTASLIQPSGADDE